LTKKSEEKENMTNETVFDEGPETIRGNGDPEAGDFKVEDRRHWQRTEEDDDASEDAESAPARPGIIETYRQRAEEAEQKLLEYIEAFKRHQAEQDQVRERLARDVDRRVDLRFGDLLDQLLVTVDDLDLSLDHVRDVAEAEPLARGVAIARDRFLATLAKHGVERISPAGEAFDPNESEAVRVDPVDDREAHNVVTETIRPGYKLGDRVIRAARVAVGRFKK
jgi:molecular chaperone GrpE